MRRGRPAVLLFVTAAAVFVLDRLTKTIASHVLSTRAPVVLIPKVLQLSYATNTGGAFGILERVPWLFAAATVAVSIAIVVRSRRITRPVIAVALGLVLGGALGNLADRLSGGLSLSGRVTDFIDFRVWPVFNLADSAIVVGALLLFFATATKSKSKDEPSE